MAEPRFQTDDDLPRTFRREREAREREARERDVALGHPGAMTGPGQREYGPSQDYAGPAADNYNSPGHGGTVTRFEVPFLHLMAFFMKAVLAAIPALVMLTMLLFAGGKVLESYFPALRHFEIKIQPIQAEVASPPATATKSSPAKK